MMAQILNITSENKVMDLATGSAGFLVSAMELMIENVNTQFGKNTTKAQEKINHLKKITYSVSSLMPKCIHSPPPI